MEKRHVAFNKIGQFRSTIKDVLHNAQYIGQDENGKPAYDFSAEKPTVRFTGTVKLHGTNSSICASDEGEIWYQSRKRILTRAVDNYDFHRFCDDREPSLLKLLNRAADNVRTAWSKPIGIISIFGEFCGGGMHSSVAISRQPRMFVVLAVKVIPYEGSSFYVPATNLRDPDNQIYNIFDFKTYTIDIDFSRPDIAQNKIHDMVLEVEAECPVGKSLGFIDDCKTGEGIVWTGEYKNGRYLFKAKGLKHSPTKVKAFEKLSPADVEKLDNIQEFVTYAVTENRLQQACEELFDGPGKEPDITDMNDFLRWVIKDVNLEESDTMKENGLIPRDVNKSIALKAKNWFNRLLNERAGLPASMAA